MMISIQILFNRRLGVKQKPLTRTKSTLLSKCWIESKIYRTMIECQWHAEVHMLVDQPSRGARMLLLTTAWACTESRIKCGRVRVTSDHSRSTIRLHLIKLLQSSPKMTNHRLNSLQMMWNKLHPLVLHHKMPWKIYHRWSRKVKKNLRRWRQIRWKLANVCRSLWTSAQSSSTKSKAALNSKSMSWCMKQWKRHRKFGRRTINKCSKSKRQISIVATMMRTIWSIRRKPSLKVKTLRFTQNSAFCSLLANIVQTVASWLMRAWRHSMITCFCWIIQGMPTRKKSLPKNVHWQYTILAQYSTISKIIITRWTICIQFWKISSRQSILES